MKRLSFGFSLMELLVVVGIIGIMSAVLYANFNDGSAQARDTERRADLRTMQSAIELYKQKNGRYPAGCNAPGTWSGQIGTDYACPSGGEYIVDIAPEYIPVLPTDPKLPDGVTNSGYMYVTNSAGTVYKLMSKNTVEEDIVNYDNVFKSCDATDLNAASPLAGICDETYPTNQKPIQCDKDNAQFKASYAVWGGYADASSAVDVERLTEDILCDIP